MAGAGPLSLSRRFTVAAVAFYAFVLAIGPFEHHDLVCHLKTPQHCTSCAASPLTVKPHAPAALDRQAFADAGGAIVAEVRCESALIPHTSSGRSPPPLV
jgi:hypothetical protein